MINSFSMIRVTCDSGRECFINPYEIQAVIEERGYTYSNTVVVFRGGARMVVKESPQCINSAWANCLLIDKRGGKPCAN